MRTILFVLETVIVLCGLSLQVVYAKPVFRSDTGSPGQKPCAPNKAIDVGLQDSPMGNTKLQHIDDLRQKSVNVLRGLRANAPVNISMDMRYNPTSLKNSYGCR